MTLKELKALNDFENIPVKNFWKAYGKFRLEVKENHYSHSLKRIYENI